MPNTEEDNQEQPLHSPERAEKIAGHAEAMREAERRRPDELRGNMMRSVITEPLLSRILLNQTDCYDVIISLNEFYEGGMPAALALVSDFAVQWEVPYRTISHYIFACLSGERILELARLTQLQVEDGAQQGPAARAAATIHRIWEDNEVHVSLTRSLTTIKADAAQRSFHALGSGITWAVLDSGIAGSHPHFAFTDSEKGCVSNLEIAPPLRHMDFTPAGRDAALARHSVTAAGTLVPALPAVAATAAVPPSQTAAPLDDSALDTTLTALTDEFGHGTHVAGIIAGHWESSDPHGEPVAGAEERNGDPKGPPIRKREIVTAISGVAPLARLVSMKVIADQTIANAKFKQTAGQGKVSWVLLAIDQVQQWNQFGRRLLVQGVNLSLGYDFDPRWFACGESPLCVEVDRLVKSGVAVVVAAGNAGYSTVLTKSGQPESRYANLSIADPGNADLAITVGSTHKEMPHRYGASYFSSRGPTGDGRLKPDLLAPGERIVSCASGIEKVKYESATEASSGGPDILFVEQTGTSMAAPHVSGAIAAFLSVRTEFIGQPERVKEILMDSAVDLKRDRTFQGAGLVDLFKAIQSI